MKKVALLIALILSATFTQAKADNDYDEPTNVFGLRGGLSIANGGVKAYNWLSFPTIGIAYAHKITDYPIYLEVGTWVNCFDHTDLEASDYDEGINELGFSVKFPVTGSYWFNIARDMNISPFFGPYFAVTTEYYTRNSANFDFGFRLGCGYNWKKLYSNFGFDFGCIGRKEYDYYHTNIGSSMSIFWTVGVNFISR